MSILARIFGTNLRAAALPSPASDYWYTPVGVMTQAGVRVDADDAKKISAWFRGRDILATVLAMLPLQLFERLPNDGGARPARGHPVFDLLHNKPNPWQDSFQWRRMSMYHLIDRGNAYNYIKPGPRGVVDQLWPIDPTLVTPERASSGRMVYHIRDPKTGISTPFVQDEIFHLRGASDDGVAGKGILEYARTSLGTALVTESYVAKVFSRGGLNSGTIENPGILNEESSKRMAQSFVTSMGDWHLPKILEQGSKFVESKMTPEDAQMLLSRKFSIDDMARWLGVPRMMLENSDPSFGNAEQFNTNFIAYSLGPWLSLFEFAINDQLVIASRKYFAQFNRFAIIRGDIVASATADVAYVNAGIRSVDEVREQHDWNKRGGASDELREPQNITGKPIVPSRGAASAEEPDEQSRAIAIASAARLLRKEVATVQKLAVRHAGDEDAFVLAVTEFYEKHAALVSATLQMTEAEANDYCAGQANQVCNGDWLDALSQWKADDYAAGLAALALDREAA